MASPLVLIYNLPEHPRTMLRFVCAGMRIPVRSVAKEDYNQSLAALAGTAPRREGTYEGEGFSEPMLVMAGFNANQFHALLDALRRERVFIPLKAVLTPTNAEWDSVKLYDELNREREALQRKD